MIEARLALSQAAATLKGAGVDSPRLDAELLLAHTLEVNRAAVLARPDRRLTPKQLTRFRNLLARRAAREPLAYILGQREFFGLAFAVDPRVLIPRPETELLVEEALRLARARPAPLLADVGAGSGAIAVSLAVHLPRATVYALDDSAGALAVTAENARRHGVAERVHGLPGNLLAPLPEPVDLITANLPYVAAPEWDELAPEIRAYEPRSALDGGADGLGLIRGLLASAAPHLRPGGALLVEIGAAQGPAVVALARQHFPEAGVELKKDYAGLDRLVIIQT
ncbi:MAG: peptide chain release factor N(5)-glutamine methyltransferase [Anaerolineae bacterium]|jgi:release factor glutamine methyltransferase